MIKKQKKEAIQQSREAASDAAVAKVFSLSAKRAIIEFCCSDESKIGSSPRTTRTAWSTGSRKRKT